jgi:hypothetical protein
MAKRLGQSVRQATPRLEQAIRRRERFPAEAHVVSVGLDRTTIPMEEPASTDREGPRRKRRKPYVRTPPSPVEVNYRMAYVGTVALTDADGDMIWSRRYSASASEGPEKVLRRMIQDVRWARRARANLPVLIVQDAAPEMWNLLRAVLSAEPSVATWHEVIDRYHFAERLTTISETLVGVDPSKLLDEWRRALDERDDAVEAIEARVEAELERATSARRAERCTSSKPTSRTTATGRATRPCGVGSFPSGPASPRPLASPSSPSAPSGLDSVGIPTASTPCSPCAHTSSTNASNPSSTAYAVTPTPPTSGVQRDPSAFQTQLVRIQSPKASARQNSSPMEPSMLMWCRVVKAASAAP